jgi:hypothetical protein
VMRAHGAADIGEVFGMLTTGETAGELSA